MAQVLIVEDEPYIVESLKFLLSRQGLDVNTVSNGLEALPGIKHYKPDLVILDIMLPGLSGFDVLQTIRRDEACKETKVMILTAKGQEQDRKRMRDLGADDFCTKPFSNSDLIERVKSLLKRTRENA